MPLAWDPEATVYIWKKNLFCTYGLGELRKLQRLRGGTLSPDRHDEARGETGQAAGYIPKIAITFGAWVPTDP